MKRIAVLVVGALIASMSLMASPASAADICTVGTATSVCAPRTVTASRPSTTRGGSSSAATSSSATSFQAPGGGPCAPPSEPDRRSRPFVTEVDNSRSEGHRRNQLQRKTLGEGRKERCSSARHGRVDEDLEFIDQPEFHRLRRQAGSADGHVLAVRSCSSATSSARPAVPAGHYQQHCRASSRTPPSGAPSRCRRTRGSNRSQQGPCGRFPNTPSSRRAGGRGDGPRGRAPVRCGTDVAPHQEPTSDRRRVRR